jgi:hypothetical protein
MGMARIVVVRGEQASFMLRFRDFPVKLSGRGRLRLISI